MPHHRPFARAMRPALSIAAASIPSMAAAQPIEFTGIGTLSAATHGGGATADGVPWYFKNAGDTMLQPYEALASTSAQLADGSVRASASVRAVISDGVITVENSARAYARAGLTVESLHASATMVVEMMLADDTPFFIRRTGAASATLTPITGAIEGNILRAGTYEIAATAYAGLSAPGSITFVGVHTIVLEACRADCDGDGAVNSSDIAAFLELWIGSIASGDLLADFDASGEVNSSDISEFLAFWLTVTTWGC